MDHNYKLTFIFQILINNSTQYSNRGAKDDFSTTFIIYQSTSIYVSQIKDDGTYITSNDVTKRQKYIDHHFLAFEANNFSVFFYYRS